MRKGGGGVGGAWKRLELHPVEFECVRESLSLSLSLYVGVRACMCVGMCVRVCACVYRCVSVSLCFSVCVCEVRACMRNV